VHYSLISRERERERERGGEESRYSTRGRNARRRAAREEREGTSKSGKRRAAQRSCHDGPRSGIFRAEIKWRNKRTPSRLDIRWARVVRRRWSLFSLYLPFLLSPSFFFLRPRLDLPSSSSSPVLSSSPRG